MILYKLTKRIFDIAISLLIIAATLPLQIIIAVVLFLVMGENPFFVQLRGLSLDQKCFYVVKFRTITTSEANKIEHNKWKDIFLIQKNSVVVDKFAGWLRLTGLDELPQIYNVLLGKMSFVGPRPLMMRDLEIMKNQFPVQYKIRNELTAKPGITGAWQLIGDRNLGVENLIALDLFYEENRSFFLDSKIFFMTIPLSIFAKNSDAIIPRIEFVSKLFSYSLQEFQISKRIKKAKKRYENYYVKLPSTWWYSSDSYDNSKKQNAKIFPIENQSGKKSAEGNK
ncbi:MAG: sugar transferase [Ignavibacteriales bacterium]|nr:sugar transferase [Ignavibacteriales bacterium]